MEKHGVNGTRSSAKSSSELQDIAKKLSALAQQIKIIAAAPLENTAYLDESAEAPRSAASVKQ